MQVLHSDQPASVEILYHRLGSRQQVAVHLMRNRAAFSWCCDGLGTSLVVL